ncbi:hypothetical protein [Curtobacterium oceanosedimentum]|uniref:Uncharacterized protein n=1 Tax=Curtobacterium oceanosedimentum TaxID=465820 RepID=A0A147DNS0_9MICO|nr:hypothetical protein [Curtobacterium oceanosedimentum]KTR51074.1 hypothetical protein NS359_12055 [Curtobacterium oceanosedimentum]
MTNQGPADEGAVGDRPGPAEDRVRPADDLDRAFGPETASVATPSIGQRVRRGTVITLAFVAVGVVIAVVLSVIVGSVQTGVGGVFPRPQAALDRFRSAAGAVPGVSAVREEETTRDSLAAYRVSAVVDAAPGLSVGQQVDLVRALSAAAADAGGNGVTVSAEVRLDTLAVGVTTDAEVTRQRLEVARTVAAIGGVVGVRCDWGSETPTDAADAQRVELATGGTGEALAAIMDVAQRETHAVFPGADVSSRQST